MNSKPRTIKFSTVLNTLNSNPISLLIGFLFTFLPILIIFVLSLVNIVFENDAPKVDYELINQQGVEITAEITAIETQNNVTINDVHPTLISYRYAENGKEVESKYKVLEEKKIENLETGDPLEIKVLNGNSIIKNIKPFRFLWVYFLLIPIPFLIIGLPFLLYSLGSIRKKLKLYKYGKVLKGKIISMIPKSGFPVFKLGQGVTIYYEYETRNGNKKMGASFTTDISVWSNKKKGESILIFVLPEKENQSCVVPKLESLSNGWNLPFE